MQILTRRVLPKQAKEVKADVGLLQKATTSTNLLDVGDTGKAVVALQKHLRAAGVYAGAMGGTFDAETVAALQKFQAAKKLPATGAVDAKTLKALKTINLFVKEGFEGKGNAAKLGQRGSDIHKVEARLARLGFLKQDQVDGIFDKSTLKAVERYAKADKQVDDKARSIGEKFNKELRAASNRYNHDAFRGRDVTNKRGLKRHKQLDNLVAQRLQKEPNKELGLGAKGRSVEWIQKHLEAAGYELGAQNGTFGSRTEAAVRAFQDHSKLPVTGKVDAKTWAKLSASYFGAASATGPSQRLNERSGAVKRTEKMLKSLGYKVDTDGVFDKKTESAVRRFQKKYKLNVSGAVGEGTLKKLRGLQWNPGSWKPGPGRLQGGDFSDWQSESLFRSVASKSKFAIIKATEDNDFTAKTFQSRWRYLGKLQKQGKLPLRMAYSFLQPGNGVGQAKHLLRTVGVKGKLPPGTRLVLDWEAAALSSPQTLRDAARYLHKKTGVWPVVYASASQISRVRQVVPKAFIWMAKWDPNIPRNVPFVQYTDSPYDKNVFNGNLKALRRFAGYTR